MLIRPGFFWLSPELPPKIVDKNRAQPYGEIQANVALPDDPAVYGRSLHSPLRRASFPRYPSRTD